MKVKICGINDIDSMKALSGLQPDYFGFIFYQKSPRFFSLSALPELSDTKKVGVFVDADTDYIVRKKVDLGLDVIQLHGNESSDYILKLKSELQDSIEIFKAISISTEKDFEIISQYQELVDLFILDTKTPLKGGSGKQFDWDLLQHYPVEKPFLLSGGIGPDDAEAVLEIYKRHPLMAGVDINSKFEISPGLKSVKDVQNFLKTIKTKDHV